MRLRIGSLFTGYAGLELGLLAALAQLLGAVGEVAWQAEKEPYCRAVLAKHWPQVHRYEDVRDVDHRAPPVDVLAGGFPCQGISIANAAGAGLDDARSGLWFEFVRIIRDVRPGIVFVENVPELLGELGRVLGPLAELGFDAEWDLFDAAAVGAPHRRERLFILAYAPRVGREGWLRGGVRAECATAAGHGSARTLANTDGRRQLQPTVSGQGFGDWFGLCREDVADAMLAGRPRSEERAHEGRSGPPVVGRWVAEPDVGRVVDGSGTRLDRRRRRARIRCLGNGVVPQQAALAFVKLAQRAGLTGGRDG